MMYTASMYIAVLCSEYLLVLLLPTSSSYSVSRVLD
jgi:hypothetical protein